MSVPTTSLIKNETNCNQKSEFKNTIKIALNPFTVLLKKQIQD